MTFASSSVKVLLRKIFFTRRVFPEGRITPVVGIGGSPSFCCKLSAITRKTRRPLVILFREKSFKIMKSEFQQMVFFMLKTSQQITLGNRKEDRRKTNLSAQHFLTSPGTEVCFNFKFPNAYPLPSEVNWLSYFKPLPPLLNFPTLLPSPLQAEDSSPT